MKRIILTAVAVALFVFVQAQSFTQSSNTQTFCCDRNAVIQLRANIAPILCLWPECDLNGDIWYNCYTQFDYYYAFIQQFGTSGPDTKFKFWVWSNQTWDLHVDADQSAFTKPTGAPASSWAIPTSKVLWRLQNVGGFSASFKQTGFTTLSETNYNGSTGNAVNDGQPTFSSLDIEFLLSPLNPGAWNYWPGTHRLPVKITAALD